MDEGLEVKEIKQRLDIQFGLEAYSMKTIYKWKNSRLFPKETEAEKVKPGRKPDEQLLICIQRILHEEPFSSIRYIAHKLKEDPSTVWRYVTRELGLVFKASRWLPHSLDFGQKKKRVQGAKDLLCVLQQLEKRQFRGIITGDQSWFTFKYGVRGAWLLPEEERPESDGSQIETEKMMVTVMWGVNGIYLIDCLPEHTSFNTSYFIEHILKPLKESSDDIWSEWGKRFLWLHLDNCKVHNSKRAFEAYAKLGFKRTPHPPYSPDIAPSDFFLFGYVKEKLKGQVFRTREKLKEKIEEILEDIPRDLKIKVFKEWITRCEWIIEHSGEYYHKD